jgi:hypothetical protein
MPRLQHVYLSFLVDPIHSRLVALLFMTTTVLSVLVIAEKRVDAETRTDTVTQTCIQTRLPKLSAEAFFRLFAFVDWSDEAS